MRPEPLFRHIEFFGVAAVGKSTLYNALRKSAGELTFSEDAIKAYLLTKCHQPTAATTLALRLMLPFVTRSKFFQNAALSGYRPLLLQDFAATNPEVFEAHLDTIQGTDFSPVEKMHVLSMLRNSYINFMTGASVGNVVVHDELFLQRVIRLLPQTDRISERIHEVLPSEVLPCFAIHVIDEPESIVEKIQARQLRGRTNFYHQNKTDQNLLNSARDEVAYFSELAKVVEEIGVKVINLDLRSGNVNIDRIRTKITDHCALINAH